MSMTFDKIQYGGLAEVYTIVYFIIDIDGHYATPRW